MAQRSVHRQRCGGRVVWVCGGVCFMRCVVVDVCVYVHTFIHIHIHIHIHSDSGDGEGNGIV